MTIFSRHRPVAAVLGAVLAVALVSLGVWAVAGRDGTPAGQPGGATATSSPAPSFSSTAPTTPPPTARTMEVTVYFHSGEVLVPAYRTVPYTPAVLTATLRQLLAGPNRAERAAGYWSWFSARTAGMLRSVRIVDHVAYVDLGDLRPVIPNASTSAGSAALLGELDTTLQQFSTVESAVSSIEGDIDAFYLWLQLSPPVTDAVRVAGQFATGVLGLVRPTLDRPRWTGTGTLTVAVHARPGRSGSVLATTVSLRRAGRSWSVTGADTGVCRLTVPHRTITSPAHLEAFLMPFPPADAQARTVEVAGGHARVLGTGRFAGFAEGLWTADLMYRQPSATTGWAVLVELAAENDGQVRADEVLGADAVPVRFGPVTAAPVIVAVSASPVLTGGPTGWLLPARPGTVTFTVTAARTSQVRFYLRDAYVERPVLIGVDSTGRNGFTLAYRYPAGFGNKRLVVVAVGPNGTAENTSHTVGAAS